MIDFQTLSVSERCKEVFDLQKSYIKIERQLAVMVSHFGYFSQDLVNGFGESTEEILISAGEKKQLIKRIFSIIIEGLQNIRVHAEPDDKGDSYGSFILAKDAEKYVILFGGLIKKENKEGLEARIGHLNSLNDDDLKEHYMKVLSNGIVSATGNAGLGFITMRTKSKMPLQIKFYPVADHLYFFTTEITLLKEH
ncbi:MAG: SiaB family protein kinase [Bacteroidota bacterium]